MKKPHEQPIELRRLPNGDLNKQQSELKSPAGGLKEKKNDCQASYQNSGKPIGPLALKLNNFLLWAGAGCAHPYFSVYFLHYTGASEKEFGRLMSTAAILGVILNLTLSSLSDRYRAHRLIYLLSLACTYLAIGLLLVPIISVGHKRPSELESQNFSPPINQSDTATTLQTPVDVLIDPLAVNELEVVQVEPSLVIDNFNVGTPSHWVYIIQVCLAIGALGITINMTFSESFTANVGHSHSESGQESYCSIRFFGALGWCLASLVLSQVDERSLNLPYLLFPWLLFTCLYGLTTFLVLVWPDKRPFSLAAELTSEQLDGAKVDMEIGLTSDKGASKISFGRRRPLSAFNLCDKFERRPKEPAFIGVRRVSLDSSLESCGTNRARTGPRRSSVAVLGSSHVIEQYELRPVTPEANCSEVALSGGLRRWSNKHNVNGVPVDSDDINDGMGHFKHVTRIQPASGVEEIDGNRLTKARSKSISLKLYLKIIELIGRRNKNMPRFLMLYAVVGFVVAMNWYFLFPYLDKLNPEKFSRLGPYVMMSGYLSEVLFYYISPRVPFKVRPSVGLSCVLLVFTIRYTTYLTFCQWPEATFWPMEMIIVVELLQSLTIGWFDCILNESALEFALEAEHCLPKLIELELIEDDRGETVEMVKSSVKLSLVGVSTCFYDGIGVAAGSLVGGWLIVNYGYSVLWQLSAAISLAIALGNLLLEWTVFKNYKSGDLVDRIGPMSPSVGAAKF